MSLDERINLELGFHSSIQYFPQYEQFAVYEQQPEIQPKVLRVGNVLQVVPTEDTEPVQQNQVSSFLTMFSRTLVFMAIADSK